MAISMGYTPEDPFISKSHGDPDLELTADFEPSSLDKDISSVSERNFSYLNELYSRLRTFEALNFEVSEVQTEELGHTSFVLEECITPDKSQSPSSQLRTDELSPSIIEKTTVVTSPRLRSLEAGDTPILHDNIFNFIPGTCFEIACSLSILQSPGEAGKLIDQHAQKLAELLEKVFTEGSEEVQNLFIDNILQHLSPSTDQIGRCMDKSAWQKDGESREGLAWLARELRVQSDGTEHSVRNMLTKIRAISGFGGICRDKVIGNTKTPQGRELLSLLGQDATRAESRVREIKDTLRHEDFDNPATRARSERAPIIDGNSLGGRPLQSAASLALGFGNVYGPESFGETEKELELKGKYEEVEKRDGRQGMDRMGKPIQDLKRPGFISEAGMEKMPKAFKEAKLEGLLEKHALLHGSGVNRWMLLGSYPKESWNADLPAASAHSGGTVDIFMGLNNLSDESLLGQEEQALKCGLMIASFMNFGGYHSFVETFPIAQAASKGERFDVSVKPEQRNPLYSSIANAAKSFTDAGESIKIFKKAYNQAIQEALSSRRR